MKERVHDHPFRVKFLLSALGIGLDQACEIGAGDAAARKKMAGLAGGDIARHGQGQEPAAEPEQEFFRYKPFDRFAQARGCDGRASGPAQAFGQGVLRTERFADAIDIGRQPAQAEAARRRADS